MGSRSPTCPRPSRGFCDVFGLVPEFSLRVGAVDLSIEMLIHPTFGYRLELRHRPGSGAGVKPGHTR